MESSNGRVLQLALLPSLLVMSFGCVPIHVGTPGPTSERVVDRCFERIREDVLDSLGRPARVNFDTAETFFASTFVEGVRGGAVHHARRSSHPIEYRCAVDIRTGVIVHASHRVIEEPAPSTESLIDACQQEIGRQVASDRGRRASLLFGPADTFVISRHEDGVRGNARLKDGRLEEKVRYECSVNPRKGIIRSAEYQTVGRPPLSNAGAIELCQESVVARAQEKRGRGAHVRFESADTRSLSRSEKEVRGEARLKTGAKRLPIAYECKVDPLRRRVTSVHYRRLDEARVKGERIIDACQSVVRDVVAADHGRRAKVVFETEELMPYKKHESRVQGRGLVVRREQREPMHYVCRVDRREQKIWEARYRMDELPAELAEKAASMCHDRLRDKIAAERGRGRKLIIDTTESYYVSNSEQGVRGLGMIRSGKRSRERDPVAYDCRVDIRRGRVSEAGFHYVRPRVSPKKAP